MNIVYDISVLGSGHYNLRARTGIFRVVENIAYGLTAVKEDNLNLSFCASESFYALNTSLDYLESNLKFKEVQFFKPRIARFKKTLDCQVCTLNEKISNAFYVKRLLLKILRKPLHCTSKLIEANSSLVDPKFLAKADIFHSPFYPLPRQAKQEKKVKNFLTIHDIIPIIYPQLFAFKEDELFQRIIESIDADDWVFCVSHSTKNDFCNYLKYIDADKVFVTHLAASELFYPCFDYEKIAFTRTKYNIPDVPYILSLSTLEPRKNIEQTIRCFARLVQQENIKELYLVLVGTKGWKYEKLFEVISNYNALKERIIITGWVDDEDLAALYSGALAFVYPSFYEGFGLPPLEAMQCGVPVITSNTSSLPEVVGDAGIMVPPTDADALCQSMLEIYNRPSLREAMSLKSLERAKQFSWEKCTQETISAYKTALSS